MQRAALTRMKHRATNQSPSVTDPTYHTGVTPNVCNITLMFYRLLADAVLVIHFIFIAFAVIGAALLLWRHIPRWVALVHLGCAAWASYVMFSGRICPLTPLENQLRQLGGEAGYSGGFIERYLLSIIYPAGITREVQTLLGVSVLLINIVIYAWVIYRWKSKTRITQK
jgi:hypothetical protein